MIHNKFVFNEVKKHKGKFILIFLATLLTMLLYNVSSSLQDSIVETRIEQVRDLTNNTQIIIVSDDDKSVTFNLNDINEIIKLKDINGYIVGARGTITLGKSKESYYINGMDLTKQDRLSTIRLLEGDINHWSGNVLAISEKFAVENHYQINDEIEIRYHDTPYIFKIKAIAENEGIFAEANTLITSLEAVQQMTGIGDEITYVELSLKELDKMEMVNREIQNQIVEKELKAILKMDLSYFHAYVSTVTLALNIFSIFLTCFTLYIMYSIYKSYAYETMSELATLRSIGYSINSCKMMMCIQVLWVIGLAFVLVLLLTPVMIQLLGQMLFQQVVKVQLNWTELLIKDIIIALLAVVSVWIATSRVTAMNLISMIKKQNIKIISNEAKKSDYIVNIVVLLLVIITRVMANITRSIILNYVLLIELLVFLVLFQRIGLFLYGKVIRRLFHKCEFSLGVFAKQIGITLKNYKQAISSMVFVTALALILSSMSSMMTLAMNQIYEGADLLLLVPDDELEDVVTTLDNQDYVTNFVVQERCTTYINGQSVCISGVDVTSFDDKDFSMILHGGNKKVFDQINEKNTIIITETLSRKLDISEKDRIEINNKEFIVVDIVKSFEDRGEVVYISTESFHQIFSHSDYCNILISTDINVDQCMVSLQDEFGDLQGINMTPISELLRQNTASNQIIINAIMMLTGLIVLISLISLYSVVEIDIQSRLREFFIYRTLGISKKELIRMSIYDGMAISIYSILLGVLMEAILLPIVADILSYYVGSIEAVISIQYIAITLLLSLIFIVGTVVIIIRKNILKKESVQCIQSC